MNIDGLRYLPDFLAPDDERALIEEVERLEYQQVIMRGQAARRTVLHFGFDYDYEGWKIHPTTPPPSWLAALRDRCAAEAAVPAESLEQFLIARYPPGATIGWHRDAPMFGEPVIGISLGAPCRMRFRKKIADGFETTELALAPRSLYMLAGEARTKWQHSIPAVKGLRWSITMRTIRRRASAGGADAPKSARATR